MSSTNKTTNYELSQFIGTDKPAWLSDYNGDMGKIDAGIYSAQTTATGADGKATTNTTAIGTLANLATTAKTDLVSAINEVNTSASTAQSTANTAVGSASTANEAITNLTNYLAMSNYGDVASANITINAGSIGSKSISYASNVTGTLGKLYGTILTVALTSGNSIITISNLPFDVKSDFSVKGMCTAQDVNNKALYYPSVNFKTNNTATITFGAGYNGLTLNISLNAVLLFIQNFGDEPQE